MPAGSVAGDSTPKSTILTLRGPRWPLQIMRAVMRRSGSPSHCEKRGPSGSEETATWQSGLRYHSFRPPAICLPCTDAFFLEAAIRCRADRSSGPAYVMTCLRACLVRPARRRCGPTERVFRCTRAAPKTDASLRRAVRKGFLTARRWTPADAPGTQKLAT